MHTGEGEKPVSDPVWTITCLAVVLSPGCPLESSREKKKMQRPNVLYFDMDSGYVDVFLCQNSLKHILKICVLYCLKSYLNKIEILIPRLHAQPTKSESNMHAG